MQESRDVAVLDENGEDDGMSAQELAALVSALCEDNMGSKLEHALSYENLDKQFQSGI